MKVGRVAGKRSRPQRPIKLGVSSTVIQGQPVGVQMRFVETDFLIRNFGRK